MLKLGKGYHMPDIIETVHLSKGKVTRVVKVASKKVPLDLVIGLNTWPKDFITQDKITSVTYHLNYEDGVMTYVN